MITKLTAATPIISLEPHVIAQVAAGEVIQRPAFVVKELLENALDAQATRIEVRVEKGGQQRIQVTDNGFGMSPENLQMSWLPHTTSKITSVPDLFAIDSFGFRGEALASMVAVADVTLRSKQEASVEGWELRIRRGKVESFQPVGMPVGTQVTVDNLFAEVPARKEFLTSVHSEIKLIADTVLRAALAHHEVEFSLWHGNERLVHTPVPTNLLDRLAALVGRDTLPHWLPFLHSDDRMTLTGFVGKPQLARRQRSQQWIFLNQRPVQAPGIAKTLQNQFGTLLEAGMHPSFIIFAELPPEEIDPNIHPQKQVVRLKNESSFLETLGAVVAETLKLSDISYSQGDTWRVEESSPGTVAGSHLKQTVDAWQPFPDREPADIAQIHDLYLVTQTADGLMMVDQHAAHERILYEQFLHTWQQEKKLGQPFVLPEPISIELSVADAALISEHAETLHALGFEIEPLLERTYLIRAVPELWHDRQVHGLVRQFLDDLNEGPLSPALHPHLHRMIAYLACRTAIKAGDPLTPQERRILLTKLSTTTTQYTCPHGRPVMVELTLTELHKLFKRL